jgi:hypothetical protein
VPGQPLLAAEAAVHPSESAVHVAEAAMYAAEAAMLFASAASHLSNTLHVEDVEDAESLSPRHSV